MKSSNHTKQASDIEATSSEMQNMSLSNYMQDLLQANSEKILGELNIINDNAIMQSDHVTPPSPIINSYRKSIPIIENTETETQMESSMDMDILTRDLANRVDDRAHDDGNCSRILSWNSTFNTSIVEPDTPPAVSRWKPVSLNRNMKQFGMPFSPEPGKLSPPRRRVSDETSHSACVAALSSLKNSDQDRPVGALECKTIAEVPKECIQKSKTV